MAIAAFLALGEAMPANVTSGKFKVMSDRIIGTVKFFTDDKGYGFITPVGGGKDIYVHRNDLMDGVRQLSTDQKVSFVVGESDRKTKGDGKKAMEVKVEDPGRLVPKHGSGP